MEIPDYDLIDISFTRQLRAVVSLTKTIIGNCPGIDPQVAKACAANIVTGLPFLGLPDDASPNNGGE
jgi:hypothetical protein